ncbi:MAG: hypothetical protein K9M45_13035 [Kiritimatiellales bacterium]|nr:hypothetical protein [Kiritimatiellales bacterium]
MYDEILSVATAAAHAAGDVLLKQWQAGEIRVNRRERHDVKLAADVDAEAAIMRILAERRPRDAIISEEAGASEGAGEGVWVIDPLDGTVNFSHRHPHFCTSVAWCVDGDPVVGVVFDPLRGELYSAVKGMGATLNGSSVGVSGIDDLGGGMLAVGFSKLSPETTTVDGLTALAGQVQKLRISGSAALDIVYTACGRLNGYYEHSIYVWDLAAAKVILEEAGGIMYAWSWPEAFHCGALASSRELASSVLDTLGIAPGECVDRFLDLC